MGELIRFATGAAGYRAAPSAGEGSGVLVLHAWWGLNDTIRGVCDRLADAGFVAIAPDYYGGKVVSTVDEAEQAAESVPASEQLRLIEAALDRLRGEPGVAPESLGVVGFSLGAMFATELAASDSSIAAAVLCYGTGERQDWSKSDAAIQGHFADDDPFESREWVDETERSIRAGGRRVEFFHYPATKHWFMEPDRPEYAGPAANLAWVRILAFLRERLD